MIALQLYIEGQEVELFKDESITLSQSIQDVKDISKIFLEFSQTFSVPASKTNNKLFKHFYNFNISKGQAFDAREKQDAEIYLNYAFFRKGKIKLEGCTLKLNKPHTYKLTFYGETVNLKDLIGDALLGDLPLLADFKFTYSDTNILDYMSSGLDIQIGDKTYFDALLFPLITHTQRLIYDSGSTTANTEELANVHYAVGNTKGVELSQLKPALRVYAIVKAIEDRYFKPSGFTFPDTFFSTNNPHFYNLYMWLHNKAGSIFADNTQKQQFTNFQLTDIQGGKSTMTMRLRNNSFVIPSPSADRNSRKRTRKIHLDITSSANVTFTVLMYKNGELYREFKDKSGTTLITLMNEFVPNGTYTFEIESSGASNFTLDVKGYWNRSVAREQFMKFQSVLSFGSGIEVQAIDYMPEIKVIDFLTGLFKMFNLTAFIDRDKNVIISTLDDYYASSTTTWDITQYVDKETSIVNSVLPYKQINFEYEGTDSFLASNHFSQYRKKWGGLKYDARDHQQSPTDKVSGEVYDIEIPFEHFKYERLVDANNNNNTFIQWGWSVDDKQSSFAGKPLLFYPVLAGGTNLSVVNLAGGLTLKSTYFVPSNSMNLFGTVSGVTIGQNINFNAEVNEYTPSVAFNDTLFKKFYNSYIEEIFDIKRRLTKLKAYLPISMLHKYSLADRLIVFNEVYKINKIVTNFETLLSDVELINITTDKEQIIPARFIETGILDLTADSNIYTADDGAITVDKSARNDGLVSKATIDVVPEDTSLPNKPNLVEENVPLEVTAPIIQYVTPTTATSSAIYMAFNVTTLGKIGTTEQIDEYGFFYSSTESDLSSTDIDTLKANGSVTNISYPTTVHNKFTLPPQVNYQVTGLSNAQIFYRFYARTNTNTSFAFGDAISPVFFQETTVSYSYTQTADVRRYRITDNVTQRKTVRIMHYDGTLIDLENITGFGNDAVSGSVLSQHFYSKIVPIVIDGQSATFLQDGVNQYNTGIHGTSNQFQFEQNELGKRTGTDRGYSATSRTIAETEAKRQVSFIDMIKPTYVPKVTGHRLFHNNRTAVTDYVFPFREGFSVYKLLKIRYNAAASTLAKPDDGFYAYWGYNLDGSPNGSTGVSAHVINGVVTEPKLFY